MYALPNKTQHKLIVKVRGGISQKLDNLSSSSANSAQPVSGDSSSCSKNFSSSILSASTSSSARASKESSLTRQFDEVGFNAELSHLPQPIFHSINQNGSKQRLSNHQRAAQKQQYITPEHNEMIKYVQSSWKGVERDYKNSVNSFINVIDLNSSSSDHKLANSSNLKRGQTLSSKKKTATTSTPLLLSGAYHHTSASGAKNSSISGRQDSFQPFDLETFWGNRILKRLTGDM